MATVVLVNMPFASVDWPALGLSSLKAVLEADQIGCDVAYENTVYAAEMDTELYTQIANHTMVLLGEWIFAAALFEDEAPGGDYITEVLIPRGKIPASELPAIRKLRAQARSFIEAAAERVLARAPEVVGLTSVFQQHTPALALARQLRRLAPELPIMFGGSNCEGGMGLETLRKFPFVDVVVSGEGEGVVSAVVRGLLDGRLDGVAEVPGVFTPRDRSALRRRLDETPPNTPMLMDLDALPIPDHADYFDAIAERKVAAAPLITFETSRGCWWGQKHHCTFCSLNGRTMAFRSKSPERALAEVEELVDRHGVRDFVAADNILDMAYFKNFVPALASRKLGLSVFYEVKSNLRHDQLVLLRDAGVRCIQPGIESLDDEILTLMRKGVSGLHNIQLLKWCKELGIDVEWNILYGFPNEDPQRYLEMPRTLAALTHLQPPYHLAKVSLQRHSPLYRERQRLYAGWRPAAPYRYIYPFHDRSLAELAYFFDYEYADDRTPEQYIAGVAESIERWRRAYRSTELLYSDLNDELIIWDLRQVATRVATRIPEPLASVYRACDQIRPVRSLHSILQPSFSQVLDDGDVHDLLRPLVDDRVLLREGDRYLALALPLARYRPPATTMRVLAAEIVRLPDAGELIRRLGKPEREPRTHQHVDVV
jgi:ribosomal peptide maturation radical SAM protein 1